MPTLLIVGLLCWCSFWLSGIGSLTLRVRQLRMLNTPMQPGLPPQVRMLSSFSSLEALLNALEARLNST